MATKNTPISLALQSIVLLAYAIVPAADARDAARDEADAQRGLREFCQRYPEFDGNLGTEALSAEAVTKYLSGLREMTDSGIRCLKGLKRLKVLNLRGSRITDAGLEELQLQPHPSLEWLSLDDTRITDAGLRYVAKMTHVAGLDLRGDRITGAGLKNLLPLNLDRLTLGFNSRITDADLEDVGRMTNLGFFELFSNQVTDAGVRYLERLRMLEYLTLVSDRITDAGAGRLSFEELPIRRLEIGGPRVTDALLERLKGCELLSQLNLMHNTIHGGGLRNPWPRSLLVLSLCNADDETLKYIGEQTKLFHLVLYRPKLTHVGLHYLKSAPRLRALSLCEFSDEDVRLVAELANLEFLYLFRPKTPNAGLRHLPGMLPSLRHLLVSEVNDEGLKYVGDVKQLRGLDLYRPRFSNTGLAQLRKLPNLEFMSMCLGASAEVQVEEARRALPKCDVSFNGWESDFLSESYLEND